MVGHSTRSSTRGKTERGAKKKQDVHVSTESDFVVSQPALSVCITERDVADYEGVIGDGRLEALEPIPCRLTAQQERLSESKLTHRTEVQSEKYVLVRTGHAANQDR